MPAVERDLAGLGLRAGRGGALVVGVALDGGQPHVVLSNFLPTAAEGDRLAFEPYHVAAELALETEGADLAATVAEGRQRQDEMAAKGLGNIITALRDAGYDPVIAALLVNRAGWITDLLTYSLEWREHAPVAEGLAVRDALRLAFVRQAVNAIELDEKSLLEQAVRALQLNADEIEASLKSLGAAAGKPWRKEQKLTCLAAWVALVQRR